MSQSGGGGGRKERQKARGRPDERPCAGVFPFAQRRRPRRHMPRAHPGAALPGARPDGAVDGAATERGNPFFAVSLLPSRQDFAPCRATSLLRGRQGPSCAASSFAQAYRRGGVAPPALIAATANPGRRAAQGRPYAEIHSSRYLSFRLARTSPCRATSLLRGRQGRSCAASSFAQAYRRGGVAPPALIVATANPSRRAARGRPYTEIHSSRYFSFHQSLAARPYRLNGEPLPPQKSPAPSSSRRGGFPIPFSKP